MKKPFLNTFKSRIILYYSLLICTALALLGLVSYETFSAFTKNEMIKSTSALANQVNKSLDIYLNEIKDSLNFISIDRDIIDILQNSTSNNAGFDQNLNRTRISVLLNNIFAEKTDIKGFFIYNEEHHIQYINSGTNLNFDSPFLKKVWNDFSQTRYALKTKFYGAHKPDYYDNYLSKVDKNVITIAANIKDAYDPSNPNLYGVALFDYNISKLKTMFDSTKAQLSLDSFVIDNEQQVIYQTDPTISLNETKRQLLFQQNSGYWIDNINGSKTLISYTTSAVTGWKTVFLLSFSQLNSKLSIIRNTTLFLLFFTIFFTVLLATVVTIRTTKPILSLVKFMKEIGKGKLDIRISRHSPYEEINVLNKGLNDMLDKINELISDLIKRQLLQKEAEYTALQAKMNPHFLYNTLQSITSLAILERNHDIEIVTHSLRGLLQYSLYQQNDMVRIKEELDCIQSYLQIQNIRYNGRLHYDFQIDETLVDYLINKFVLQPIVENAIYHGLENKEGTWNLWIHLFSENDLIHLEIRDNGIGIQEQQLHIVKQQLIDKETRTGRIGLSNIMDRMDLKFGSKAKLEITSQSGTGTTIVLTIPHITRTGELTDVYNNPS